MNHTHILAATAAIALSCIPAAAKFPSVDETVAAFKAANGAVEESAKGSATYYIARDASGNAVKVAYLKETRGYKGKLDLFVVVVKGAGGLAFESVQIVEGKNVYKEVTKGAEAAFLKQFSGKTADQKLKVDAMTSATQTSKTITRAIEQEQKNVAALFNAKK
ncbi:FMN-binding protein [bacterium]|nr:FMN-binding protein [bacterium]